MDSTEQVERPSSLLVQAQRGGARILADYARSLEALLQQRDEQIARQGQNIKALYNQRRQAEAQLARCRDAHREMLGSYEALARMVVAHGVNGRPDLTVENLMGWDGPICARRALAESDIQGEKEA
jgi:hypothetical protein